MVINMETNERRVGTISRGIRCPIIREGDDLADIVTKSVLEAAKFENFNLRDKDVISITESIVARAQGNYASVDAIAEDVKNKLGGETIGVIFPILSRNRFSICLKGIAKGAKKIVLMLSTAFLYKITVICNVVNTCKLVNVLAEKLTVSLERENVAVGVNTRFIYFVKAYKLVTYLVGGIAEHKNYLLCTLCDALEAD